MIAVASRQLDLYALLEVNPSARPEVIKAAYRELMKIHHPDHSGKTSVAQMLNDAYATLSDPDKRTRFDQGFLTRPMIQDEKTLGDFQITEQISRGSFGRTFRGIHIPTGGPVCIKISHEVEPKYRNVYREVLRAEALAMWTLRHFAVPIVHGFIELSDGRCALVTSLIPGLTIEQIVTKIGPIPPIHIGWIVDRTLNGLKYTHFYRIYHGDVKPQNIIVQPKDGTAVLVDFGFSEMDPQKGKINKGYTLHYAPPEQVDGDTIVPQTDYYSLGMTMIYMLTGSVSCVERKTIPHNVDVHPAIVRFISRITKRSVFERPDPEQEDLWHAWLDVRQEAFGSIHSNGEELVV